MEFQFASVWALDFDPPCLTCSQLQEKGELVLRGSVCSGTSLIIQILLFQNERELIMLNQSGRKASTILWPL